jgi:hypothetical protein
MKLTENKRNFSIKSQEVDWDAEYEKIQKEEQKKLDERSLYQVWKDWASEGSVADTLDKILYTFVLIGAAGLLTLFLFFSCIESILNQPN